MGNHYIRGYFKVAAFILLSLAVFLGLPQLNPAFFPVIGEPSADYDCDDETLDMYRHFAAMGMECAPVVGNLDIEGESYTQSNHVWLLINSGGKQIAYDWGTPRFDKQHYEGFKITLDYLLYAVEQDKKSPDLLGIANGE